MPLVPLRPLMKAAEQHNYTQGAFNVNAVSQAKAVMEMHEIFRSPAILQNTDLANAEKKLPLEWMGADGASIKPECKDYCEPLLGAYDSRLISLR